LFEFGDLSIEVYVGAWITWDLARHICTCGPVEPPTWHFLMNATVSV
jgi:hypothetical protein